MNPEIKGDLLVAEPVKPVRTRSTLAQLIRAADQPFLAGLIIGTYCFCAIRGIETSAPFDSIAFLAAAYFFKHPGAPQDSDSGKPSPKSPNV